MNRYKKTFERLKKKGEAAFIPFAVIGDPDYSTSLDIVKAMVDGGADILELGLPFSDPIADGPVIQSADIRALESGMNTDRAFKFIEDVRKFTDIPIGLLVYSNLICQRRVEKFYIDAKKAGVDSVLPADIPFEESGRYSKAAKNAKVGVVSLATELTTNKRLKKIIKNTDSFVYVIARLGVTGVRKRLGESTVRTLRRMRPLTKLPLCVGFGISEPEHVREVVKAGADGAIAGSAAVKIIEKNLKSRNVMMIEVKEYVRKMKSATR